MLLLGDITVSTLNNIYLIPLNDGSPGSCGRHLSQIGLTTNDLSCIKC